MSHEIIKAIKLKDGKCLVTSCSNNVTPRIPHEWNCTFISEILQTQGETAATISILEAYESGNFKAGTPNKYSRAIDRLRYLPEYQNYNWRNKYNGDKELDAQIEADRSKAKKFSFEQEIERLKTCFVGGEKWTTATI